MSKGGEFFLHKFYDGTRLLSMMDADGEKPEIYMCTDYRSTGKTTFFIRMLLKRFINKKEKFVYLVRFNVDVPSAYQIIGKVASDFFDNVTITGCVKDQFWGQIQLNNEVCGYVLPLNAYDKIKPRSAIFSDATSMILDEFQSESNHYVPNEMRAIDSVHTSLARCKNKSVKYMPLYLLSNHVTMLNPYYTLFGIRNLHEKTRYMKGHGWVLEQLFTEEIAKTAKTSGFRKAFERSDYSTMFEHRYLMDDVAYIVPQVKDKKYSISLHYKNQNYGVWETVDGYYVSHEYDESYPIRYTIESTGIMPNSSFIKKSPVMVELLRNNFRNGNIIFDSLDAKDCLMSAITY